MWSKRPALPGRLRIVLLALWLAWIPASGAAAGVVVAAVAPGSAAERAGLLPGDVLLGWERLPEHGRFTTPWDVWIVEIEQAPRTGLTLYGERAGRDLLVQPPAGDWELTVEPSRADPSQREGWSLFQQAEALRGTREAVGLATARQLYLQALAHPAHRVPAAQIQIWDRIGSTDLAREDFSQAQEAFRQALSILGAGTGESLLQAYFWHRMGLATRRGDQLGGEEAFRRAWEIRRRLAPDSLAEAATLGEIGSIAVDREELERAEAPLRRAVEIRRRLDPGDLAIIRSLNALGAVAVQRSRVDEAHQLLDEALALVEHRAPGTLRHSEVLNNRALLAEDEGDLAAAAAFLRRSLEIDQKLAPGSRKVAITFNNLGLLAQYRGDFATAEALHEKSLAINERTRPGSLAVANSLTNLGIVAAEQGDGERARELLERALALYRQLFPSEGLPAVSALAQLGKLAADRGDFPAAENFSLRALAVVEREAPESNMAAEVLADLGRLARQRGDFDAAEQLLRRALERSARIGPRSIRVAQPLRDLADLAVARGHWAEAEDLYRQALALSRELTPGSLNEALDLRGLGRVKAHTGRKAEAAPLLLQALDALEAQVEVAGATRDVRIAFRAASATFYAEAVDVLLDLGQVEAAFQTVERSRARGLLELLAGRDLELSRDLPPELVARRRQLAREDDRLQNALSRLQADKDAAEIQRLLAQRKDVGERRARLAEEIRRAAPRRAAYTDPRVLGWPEVRAALDPGTALLSYLVEERRTLLFVGIAADPPRPLAVFSLPVGDQALRKKMARLQRLVGRRNRQRSAADSVAQELYEALLAPAAPLLADARRLLILPDGPLHVLPFAALVRRTSRGSQYLVEWKPFSTAASATVHVELLHARTQEAAPAAIVAFADPQYLRPPGTAVEPSPALRSSLRRGLSLAPLPASREEALAISRLFGGETRLYLGAEATEEKVKSISRARYLHFACHGLYDKVNPLDSALALTLPETLREDRDNGLLQAWEIFEQVQLEADLVTLSACQSGLGQEVAGEGLIGLTRAFHYAGARSVVASLWEVADRSTADLMQRFYAALRQGAGKDEALRQAQIALIRRSLPPFHWAAFQLSGDWR